MKKAAFKRIGAILCLYLFCFLIALYAQEQVPPTTKTEPAANLVSLNLKDVNIEDALKIIAEASGLNIILDKDVAAKVNIILKDVPWQTALENILKTNELTYRIQGNIIRVMTLITVKKEEAMVPLVSKIITLNFAKTDELQKSLGKMLSERGGININARTNALIITDTPELVAKIEEMANKLDTATPQVMIEALILDLQLRDEDELGIDWKMVHKERPERTIEQNLSLATQNLASVGAIRYGRSLIPVATLELLIDFWKQQGRVEILANPRISTLDNLPAHIELIEQIPYVAQTQTDQGVVQSTQFKDSGIKLTVTPHVTTKDNYIMVTISTEQSFLAGTSGGQPIIDSRKAETTLMVKDGETIAIGGLKRKQDTTTITKFPVLGDIPLVGYLFRNKVSAVRDTELLIFVTPYLREKVLVSPADEKKLEKFGGKLRDPLDKEELEEPKEKLSSSIKGEEKLTEPTKAEFSSAKNKEGDLESSKEQLSVTTDKKSAEIEQPKEKLLSPTDKDKAVLRDVVIAEALVEALDKVSKPSVKETKR